MDNTTPAPESTTDNPERTTAAPETTTAAFDNAQAYAPFRLVAEFSDGARLLFDGLTEQQALDRIAEATRSHGDLVWYDGVTDLHYERGRYHALVPSSEARIVGIDLTEYDGPRDENGLPPSLTGRPPVEK